MKKILTILLAITLIVSTSTNFVFATENDIPLSSAENTAEDTEVVETITDDETLVSTDTLLSVDTEPIEATDTDASMAEENVETEDNFGKEEIKLMSDLSAPGVTSVTPSGNDVTTASVVKVSFDTVMDRSTLTTDNITVTNVTDDVVVTPAEASAYDTDFVFTADFESYKTYKITVSTAVTSAEGVALSEDYEHTFTTGEVMITTNIASAATITGGATIGGAASLTDGKKTSDSSPWFTYGGASGTNIMKAEFPEAKEFSHIIFYPYKDSSPISGIKVEAANNADYSDSVELAVLPTFSEFPGVTPWIAPVNGEYKFIRIKTNHVIEFEAYSYTQLNVVNITPSGDNLTRADVAKVTFDMAMDRSTLTTDNITITNVTKGEAVTPTATSAYDASFVFAADFESNTEYKITVSASVKTATGVSLSEDYEHTFTTGELTKISNIASEATYTRRPGGSFSGADSALKYLTDGKKNYSNSGTVWYNYGLGTGVANWAQANFDSEKNIAYVVYYPYKDGNPKNAKFLASVDGTNWDELESVPNFSAHPGNGSWIAVVENDKAYKYIRMQTTYIDELEIFAYVTPEVTNITPGVFGETSEFITDTAICSVEFSTDMDLSTLTPDNIIVTRDSDGSVMTQTTPSRNPEAKQEAQAYSKKYIFACDFEPNTAYTITVTSNVISLAGNPMLEDVVHSFSTGPYLYSVNNITPNVPEAYTISQGSNSSAGSASSLGKLYDGVVGTSPWFNYGGTSDKWIIADLGEAKEIAFVACMADLPNDSEGARSANLRFEVSNDPDFEEGVVSLGKVPAITEWKGKVFWSVPSDGNAYQYVRITDNGALYVSELEIYEYYRDDPAILAAIEAVVTDFTQVSNNTDFESYITRYAYTTPFFSLRQEIPEMDADTASHAVMGDYLLTVRPLILKAENNSIDDVISTLKGAYAWYSLCNKDESTALSVFEKYGASLGDISDISTKGAFVKLMSALKSNITGSTKFTKAFNEAKIYSAIQDATVESTVKVLENHASVFGIDLSYASGKNVTLTEVAKRIDRVNTAKYIDLSAESSMLLNSDYRAIVDQIEAAVIDFTQSSDSTDFESYITNSVFNLEQEIPEMDADTASHAVMGDYLLTVRPLILKAENNTMDDVISTFKGAYALYSLCNKDEDTALSVFEKYGASLGDISDISTKGAFVKLMSALKSNITDSTKFTRAFNEAKIYSAIQDATVESTVNALKNHASVFGIDLSYASGKNVTLTDVARKIDRVNTAKYIDLSAESSMLLNSDYRAIVDEIYQSRISKTPNKVVTGGGGGSGGGSLSFSKTEFAPAKTEDKQEENNKPAVNISFTDIDDVPWAKEQIERLATKGILAGKGDSTFAPSDSVKREEIAKMLYLAFSFEDAKTSGKVFSDCDMSAWYYPYVTAMNNAGIINGYSDTEFGTGHAITRQDFALMLYRILTVNYKIFAEPSAEFADSDKIADYAKDAVLSMASAGIISGYPDGTIGAADAVTRAQAAVMIANSLDYIAKTTNSKGE